MSVVYILIPLGLVLLAAGAWAFFWAVGNGQFDDLETPGWSVLVDEQAPERTSGDQEVDDPGESPPQGPRS